ncbi:MAG: helix-turn-helix transcriptional regulator [Oscillospiraceae bacterium]|nr:helix-turn-helix transcriptional regulator [Oscillospiraceae bacterium]
MLDAMIVGKVIQRFREEKALSQEVLSGLADIGRTHLSAIERGTRKPTLETFFRICEALDMRPSILLAAIEDEIARNHPDKK